MRRPAGYTTLALLLALVSLSGLSAVLWQPSDAPAGMSLLAAERIVAALQGLAGVATAWTVWSYRRRAPEAFAGWAVVAIANVAYYTSATVPQLVGAFAARTGVRGPTPAFPIGALVLQLVTGAGILGLISWYLTVSHGISRCAGDLML